MARTLSSARGRGSPLLPTALLMLLLAGCASAWEAVPPPASSGVTTQSYGHVRVTTRAGEERELTGATVERDSLFGHAADSTRRPVAIALADIVRLDVLRTTPSPILAEVGDFTREVLKGTLEFFGSFVGCMLFRKC